MRLEDLNWMDVERYLEQDDRLILILGACEQHGYLSLLTDIKIPLALADSASNQTGVLVAPPLNFGVSPYFLDYPGTLSFSVRTMISAVEDMVRSAYRQGFRRILVLNGHGGNSAARQHLSAINNDLPSLKMSWYDWWMSHSVEEIAQKHNIKPAHANWLEAFSFTIVGELPDGSKTPPKVPSAIMAAGTMREVYGDGSFGGPYRVDDAIMQEVLNAALEDILLMLKFE
ncbi:MAG: creatininase family protein [Anaerolineales bacterium]